jgi:hypothetical protein
MARTDTPVPPFAEILDASSRAITASADLYTDVLRSQAAATAGLIEAYVAAGREAAGEGADTTAAAAETAEQTATKTARGTARATRRATKRTAGATRKAAASTRKAAPTARKAAATTRKAAATTRQAAASTRQAAASTRNAGAAARKAAAAPAKALEPPVTGYDDLTADELVAKLPEFSQAQLVQVAAYERAHDKRATVLDRVTALTGPEPAPGYDELTADEAQKLVTGGDAELAATVRDYERRHKDRASVVEAAVRNADAS